MRRERKDGRTGDRVPGARRGWLLAGLLGAVLLAALPARADDSESCRGCHREKNPGLVSVFLGSAHAGRVSCGGCHGDDARINHDPSRRARVTAAVCARCHPGPAREHFASRHGVGFRAGRACTRNDRIGGAEASGCGDCHEPDSGLPRQEAECARFLRQSPEMQRRGCLTCHQVEDRCDACHGSHSTDRSLARDPRVCATCHMGPDHPQYEMWKSSRHGVLHARGGPSSGPGCVACHMPEGTHDVGFGITMGLAGQPMPEERRRAGREEMLGVCTACHTRRFAASSLSDGDAVQKQAKAVVDEAAEIVRALAAEDLLRPSPAARPAHPLSGRVLEIGPQMLYEDLSRAEAILFRMKKFYYVTAYKGVFHQNPDYAHWYGNAPLKLALSELKSEAARLRAVRALEMRLDNLAAGGAALQGGGGTGLVERLRRLKERHLRGDLDREDYEARKKRLLDEAGL